MLKEILYLSPLKETQIEIGIIIQDSIIDLELEDSIIIEDLIQDIKDHLDKEEMGEEVEEEVEEEDFKEKNFF